jgi:hypothetical protein
MPLDEHVDLIVGQNPYRFGGADQLRVVHDHVLKLIGRAATDQLPQNPLVLAALDLREEGLHRIPHQGRIVGGGQVVDIEHRRIEMNVEQDLGLSKSGIPFGDNGAKQQHQEHQAGDNGRKSEQLKPFFLAVTGGQADVDPVHGGDLFILAHAFS